MPVTGTEVATPSTADHAVCEDLSLVQSETSTHEGCALLLKRRHVSINKGARSTIRWEMRNRSGETINLSSCLVCPSVEESASVSVSESEEEEACGSVKVRFSACDEAGTIYERDGTSPSPDSGLVQFGIPTQIADVAGLYRMDIGILNADDELLFTNTGLLSVERGLFGDRTKMTGPPTLGEIRMHLRDSTIENDLLMDVEFDDDEIVNAIIRPVMEWNETPPHLRRYVYNCSTFPWRKHWLDAIAGELLATAAHWYARNKVRMSHGGISVDDRNKDQEYMQLAQLHKEGYKEFVLRRKVELNAGQLFGTISSDYA